MSEPIFTTFCLIAMLVAERGARQRLSHPWLLFLAVILVLWRFDVGSEPGTETFRGRLVVEAAWAPGLEPVVVSILERHAKRWKLIHSEPTALTYAVQLFREGSGDALVTAVRNEPSSQVTDARFEPRGP